MENSLKLAWLHDFLVPFEDKYVEAYEQRPRGGAPKTFSHSGFLVFFISMFLQRVFAFKSMTKYAKLHFAAYRFSRPPCRKTIRERFKKMPKFVVFLMPCIAKHCAKHLCHRVFRLSYLFSDKSIFRAKGGVWHKKHMEEGVVPHPSIDTDASWATSPYHKWRFGYGLLVLVNESRFPVACFAGTAKFNEPAEAVKLLEPLKGLLGILVGDAAYTVWEVVSKLWHDFDVLLLTKWNKLIATTEFQQQYKALVRTAQAYWLYGRRKPSVEPFFSLVKELFCLKRESQLPYKGMDYVCSFLLVAAICAQLLMVFNFSHKFRLCSCEHFLELFRGI